MSTYKTNGLRQHKRHLTKRDHDATVRYSQNERRSFTNGMQAERNASQRESEIIVIQKPIKQTGICPIFCCCRINFERDRAGVVSSTSRRKSSGVHCRLETTRKVSGATPGAADQQHFFRSFIVQPMNREKSNPTRKAPARYTEDQWRTTPRDFSLTFACDDRMFSIKGQLLRLSYSHSCHSIPHEKGLLQRE